MKVINEYKLVKGFNQIKIEDNHVKDSKTAVNIFRALWDKYESMEVFESFYLLLLDSKNRVTGFTKISQGTATFCLIDMKYLVNVCASAMATGVILCHNHPSGNLEPSPADNSLTDKIAFCLGVLDIKLWDHIVITADSYTSMDDLGKLNLDKYLVINLLEKSKRYAADI